MSPGISSLDDYRDALYVGITSLTRLLFSSGKGNGGPGSFV